MSNVVVADASVAIKWVLAESLSENAHALLADFTRIRRRFIGPPHLYSEVTNALHQRTRRRDLSTSEADAALDAFLALNIQQVGPADLYRDALAIARKHQQNSVYDTLYVALADVCEADLWTDDQGLLNSIGKVLPWVRWIGDYKKAA